MCGGSGGKRGQRALRRSVSGLASIKLGLSALPPLATEERTPESAAPGHFRTCAPQQRASSLDRLVGDHEHARRIVRPVAGKVLSCPKKRIIRPPHAREGRPFLYWGKKTQQIGLYSNT